MEIQKLDREKIELKLTYLKSILNKAQRRYDLYKEVNDEEELETLFAALSKFIEEIIEVSVIINNELLKAKGEFSGTYHSSFKKVISYYKLKSSEKDIFEKCATYTRVRNIVVHEYATLVEESTIEDFKEILYWYPQYLKIVVSIL